MQLGAHPFFRSFMERAKVLGNNPVVEKVGNLREDIRERWETTDNPTVQRFQVRTSHFFRLCYIPWGGSSKDVLTRTHHERKHHDRQRYERSSTAGSHREVFWAVSSIPS